MNDMDHTVDGFRFLPPGLAAWLRTFIPESDFSGPIPWSPLSRPLADSTVALVTSAGVSRTGDPPFDMEREKREPTWGDRSFRKIPAQTDESQIQVNHLHINTDYISQDMNVILPIARLAELEQEEIVGRAAPTHYSFYGFQWEGDAFLDEAIAPMAEEMKKEGVKAVFLTPA